MSEIEEFDIVVIGAGAGGLAASCFAALEGARTLLLESSGFVGGTSALSAGTTWAPNTRLSATVGAKDSPENVLHYLDNAVGNRSSRSLREAFVANAPRAIHKLMDETDAQFRAYSRHPDYLTELEGSAVAGRAIEPLPFDSAKLGSDMALIRPPIPEFTVLGGLMVDRTDINHFLSMSRSFKSLSYAVRLLGGYLLDKVRYGRSTRLVMGNALVGRLLMSAKNAGVEIRNNTRVMDISRTQKCSLLTLKDGPTIKAKRGLIVATGGFGRHPQKRREMLPQPTPEYSPAAPGHTGELHDILLKLGARYGEGASSNAFLAPVSKCLRRDGSTAVFPHFVFDRSKPHTVVVNKQGRRFTNEARSYHEFATRQFEMGAIPCFLITDAVGLKKYGLGMVRPGGMGKRRLERDGYLVKADTLQSLASKLSIDPIALANTIARFNEFAQSGKDADFGRGSTIYECHNGDATHAPNPTLGTISAAPFYAVELWPSDIGSATGFLTDEHARLLDQAGTPMDGMYVCGNDMHSIMGGVYPGPGITIGPAITFAYIAVQNALGLDGNGSCDRKMVVNATA